MMWKEIFIFSIGVAVGIVVGFAINGFEIDINVNHNINLPTGIVIRSDAASGWAGWALAHPEFGISVNPITTRGQIMPTTLLLAHPDLKTHWHL